MSVSVVHPREVGGPPTIPDSLVAASVRGNAMLPQLYGAAVAFMGTIAIRKLRDGEMTYSQFLGCYMWVNDEQVARIGAAVNAAHAKYNVAPYFDPNRAEGTSDVERLLGQPLIDRQSLTSTVANTVSNVCRVLIGFSRDVIDLPEPQNPGIERSDFRSGRAHVDQLLNNPVHADKLEAIIAVFDGAKAVLRTPRALSQAKHYRDTLSEKHRDPKAHTRVRAEQEYLTYRLLREEMGGRRTRREIYAQTGYRVSRETLHNALHNLSYGYGRKLADRADFRAPRRYRPKA